MPAQKVKAYSWLLWSQADQPAIVEVLIEAASPLHIDTRAASGDTALHRASLWGCHRAVSLLLRAVLLLSAVLPLGALLLLLGALLLLLLAAAAGHSCRLTGKSRGSRSRPLLHPWPPGSPSARTSTGHQRSRPARVQRHNRQGSGEERRGESGVVFTKIVICM